MKKHKKNRKYTEKPLDNLKKYIIYTGSLIVIVVLLFVFRGWLRVTVIPKTIGEFYVGSVQTTFNQEIAALQNPYKLLSFTNPKAPVLGCQLSQAQSIHTEIDCNDNQISWTVLPKSAAGIAAVEQNAAKLQSLLMSQGWQAGSNGVTVTSLIDGTAKGIDWSPDANYQKIVGKTDCLFDEMIGYANPQPPAIRVTFSCDRTVNVLGTPKGEVYNSAKGFL